MLAGLLIGGVYMTVRTAQLNGPSQRTLYRQPKHKKSIYMRVTTTAAAAATACGTCTITTGFYGINLTQRHIVCRCRRSQLSCWPCRHAGALRCGVAVERRDAGGSGARVICTGALSNSSAYCTIFHAFVRRSLVLMSMSLTTLRQRAP